MEFGWSESDSILVSTTWREKQLEYSYRRGLMNAYVPFSKCTKQALQYSCKYHDISLSEHQQSQLLLKYRELDAFADTDCLYRLKKQNYELYAFSNGTEVDVCHLLENANLQSLFAGIVSVDDVKTFKPNPVVYHHFMTKSLGNEENSILVSSNPFDVIGALNVGMRSVWLQRDNRTIFDSWDIQPTYTISSLSDLIDLAL